MDLITLVIPKQTWIVQIQHKHFSSHFTWSLYYMWTCRHLLKLYNLPSHDFLRNFLLQSLLFSSGIRSQGFYFQVINLFILHRLPGKFILIIHKLRNPKSISPPLISPSTSAQKYNFLLNINNWISRRYFKFSIDNIELIIFHIVLHFKSSSVNLFIFLSSFGDSHQLKYSNQKLEGNISINTPLPISQCLANFTSYKFFKSFSLLFKYSH